MNKILQLRHHASSPHRRSLRLCVRKSRDGCCVHFQKVVEHFIHLVVEYLAVSGYSDPREIEETTEQVFLSLWSQIPLASRVSDVERLLWLQLSSIPVKSGEFQSPDPFSAGWWQKIHALSNEQRFILVAREMEDWPIFWIALAMRMHNGDLEEALYKIRYQLLKDTLPAKTSLLETHWKRFSSSWNKRRTTQECRSLDSIASGNPSIRKFKHNWLQRRCDLIEFRQGHRFSEKKIQVFTQKISARVSTLKRCKPALKTKIMNTFHFNSLPASDLF